MLHGSTCFSQSIVTDRPDQTESALVVPVNSLQIETGFVYESLNENGITLENYSITGTLIRYGIIDDLELRFGGAYLITSGELTKKGPGNFLTGIKFNITDEADNSFAFGILAHAILPFGDAAFNPPDTDPQLVASVSKSVSERLSLSANLGARYSSLVEEMIYNYSAALGISLTNLLSMFIEAYGNIFIPYPPIHNFDGGLTYLLSDDLQLDLSGGKGISGIESFWFVSTGVSLRFNNL